VLFDLQTTARQSPGSILRKFARAIRLKRLQAAAYFMREMLRASKRNDTSNNVAAHAKRAQRHVKQTLQGANICRFTLET
jgi:hypothetical protein